MKNILETENYEEIVARINRLNPASVRLWGRMNIAQMLAHCNASIMVASGRLKLPRTFIGRTIGPLFKARFYNDVPYPRNSPTDKNFVIVNERDFIKEREILLSSLKEFHDGGEENATRNPHPAFGHMTPKQWGMSQYKHLDHHLKQFGN